MLTGRSNDGVFGAWLVGHAVTDDGASLAIALGWAPDAAAAAAAEDAVSLDPAGRLGRYLVSESPHDSDFEAGERSALSVGELINLWAEAPETTYAGYLVASEAPAGAHDDRLASADARGGPQLAQPVLRRRVGDLRRLRDLPLVPARAGCRGSTRRTREQAATASVN